MRRWTGNEHDAAEREMLFRCCDAWGLAARERNPASPVDRETATFAASSERRAITASRRPSKKWARLRELMLIRVGIAAIFSILFGGGPAFTEDAAILDPRDHPIRTGA